MKIPPFRNDLMIKILLKINDFIIASWFSNVNLLSLVSHFTKHIPLRLIPGITAIKHLNIFPDQPQPCAPHDQEMLFAPAQVG